MTQPTEKGSLSKILTANAKIAMPEVTDIFISKYEDALYNKKAELQLAMSELQKEQGLTNGIAAKGIDFSKLLKVKVPALNLISFHKEGPSINWDNETATVVIGFHNTDEAGEPESRGQRGTGFGKTFEFKLKREHIVLHKSLEDKAHELELDLSATIAAISDMPRKQRQVRARISEMHLEEQGLEHLMADETMAALIKI